MSRTAAGCNYQWDIAQQFIRVLIEHYGYDLAQMDQERRTQHGHKSPRADIFA